MCSKVLLCALGSLMFCVATQSFAAEDYITCVYPASAAPSGNSSTYTIHISSFTWGVTSTSSGGTGNGSGEGKVALGTIGGGSAADGVKLLQVAVQGAIGSLSCGFYNSAPSANGGTPTPYLTAVLTNAVLSTVELSNNEQGSRQRMKLWFIIDSILWR